MGQVSLEELHSLRANLTVRGPSTTSYNSGLDEILLGRVSWSRYGRGIVNTMLASTFDGLGQGMVVTIPTKESDGTSASPCPESTLSPK
jgi:hypothetical protein